MDTDEARIPLESILEEERMDDGSLRKENGDLLENSDHEFEEEIIMDSSDCANSDEYDEDPLGGSEYDSAQSSPGEDDFDENTNEQKVIPAV